MEEKIIDITLLADDTAIIVELYRRYWQGMYLSAFKVLKDKEACEDIVQDIFLRIWNRREALHLESTIEAYLHTAVRYEVFKYLKEYRKFQHISIDAAAIYSELLVTNDFAQKEFLQDISSIVNQLPPKCREVYLLSRGQQLSHKEIAERLSISPGTVRNHLTRALRQLRIDLPEIMLLILSCGLLKK